MANVSPAPQAPTTTKTGTNACNACRVLSTAPLPASACGTALVGQATSRRETAANVPLHSLILMGWSAKIVHCLNTGTTKHSHASTALPTNISTTPCSSAQPAPTDTNLLSITVPPTALSLLPTALIQHSTISRLDNARAAQPDKSTHSSSRTVRCALRRILSC